MRTPISLRDERLHAPTPLCMCCGHKIDGYKMFRNEDDDATIYTFNCHGATENYEILDRDLIREKDELPRKVFKYARSE